VFTQRSLHQENWRHHPDGLKRWGTLLNLNVVWAGKFAAATGFVSNNAFWQQPELSAKQAIANPTAD
jgi:hypothetical protein